MKESTANSKRTGPDQYPVVSIVMPVKNEQAYMDEALDAIDRQNYPKDKVEIIVVDGGSSDSTVNLIRERSIKDPRIRIAGGPGVNCPLGMNIGIQMARGSIVAKIDGHGYINDEFIATAVRHIVEHPDVSCVGGQIIPISTSDRGRSNYLARFSKFGVGGGIYTLNKNLQETDTVQCGVYVKEHLIKAGLFDPDLQFGEDEEANFRVTQSGGKIIFHPGMKFFYYVRPTFQSLYRQYFNYGVARVKVLRKHTSFFKLKHVLPAAAVLALVVTAALLVVSRSFAALFVVVWGGYVCFVLAGALLLAQRNRFYRFHYLVTSLVCLHMGYGIGTLIGAKMLLFDNLRGPRRVSDSQV